MQQQERIKYKTEVLKLMALFLVAVGGSSLSLGLGTLTAYRIVLMVGGFALTGALALGIWKQHQLIGQLIEQLEE